MADVYWVDGDVVWVDGDVVWIGEAIIVQAATHAHSVDSPTLTQKHTLAVQGATHAHSVDGATVVLHLAPADATHSHSSDNISLTQKHTLVAQGATHSQTVDNVSVNLHLAADDATHAHSVDSPTINFTIVAADATHAHSADNLVIIEHKTLVANGATHAHTADVIDLEQRRNYGVASIQAGIVQEIKNIIQDTTYGYNDILEWMNDAQEAIAGGVFIVLSDRTQVFTSPLEPLETSEDIATTTNAYADLPSDYQRDLVYILNATRDLPVNIVETFERMITGDPVLETSGDVIEAVIKGNRLYYRGIPDSSQTLTLYYFRKPDDMASYTSTGVSFSGTTISDSNDGLGVFYAGQTIDLTGSNKNRGDFEIVSVESDGSEMTVDSTTTTESAGDSITIRSRPDGLPEHLQSDALSSYVAMRYFQRKSVTNIKMGDFAKQYAQEFYDTMIDIEVSQERTRRPMRMVANG